MSMKAFLKANRKQIDAHIRGAMGRLPTPWSDEDRKQWIANDEALYNWARSEGVRV